MFLCVYWPFCSFWCQATLSTVEKLFPLTCAGDAPSSSYIISLVLVAWLKATKPTPAIIPKEAPTRIFLVWSLGSSTKESVESPKTAPAKPPPTTTSKSVFVSETRSSRSPSLPAWANKFWVLPRLRRKITFIKKLALWWCTIYIIIISYNTL